VGTINTDTIILSYKSCEFVRIERVMDRVIKKQDNGTYDVKHVFKYKTIIDFRWLSLLKSFERDRLYKLALQPPE